MIGHGLRRHVVEQLVHTLMAHGIEAPAAAPTAEAKTGSGRIKGRVGSLARGQKAAPAPLAAGGCRWR